MSKLVHKKHTVDQAEDSLRKADKIVLSLCDRPRSQIRAMFQNDCVRVDGVLVHNPGLTLESGQVLELSFEENRKYKEKKVVRSELYRTVYEDGHLVVVHKEAGLLTVPTSSGKETQTLLDLMQENQPRGVRLHVVHRLDRDTSGLLVFAKSAGICKKLKGQFEDRKPERIYDAFLYGNIMPRSGSFQSYLATDKDLNQYSVDNEDKGKLAITHYEVERYIDHISWVKIRLETGRRNQIRVHFSEQGYPLLGDVRYAKKGKIVESWKDRGLALHASTLGFKHPISNKYLKFESDLPERMKGFLVKPT